MFKQKPKTIAFSALVFLFVGAFSAFAAWPAAPAGSNDAGWLGMVFNIYGSTPTRLVVNQEVQATSFIYTSDVSLKKNIQTLENALDKVKNLRGVSFDWKKTGASDVGFIAQEVEAVYPELVVTSEADGIKALKYGNITAILVEAIKEQQKEIDFLKAEIESCKK